MPIAANGKTRHLSRRWIVLFRRWEIMLRLEVLSAFSFFIICNSASAQVAGSATDGGMADAGVVDAGTQIVPDAGPLTTDGGSASDAGISTSDAGAPALDAGPPTTEPVWLCDPAYFDNNDGCDCECGIPDPDCSRASPADPNVYGCPANTQCSAIGFCEIEGCGNGVLDGEIEVCDDGNNEPFDGCTPSCRQESGWSCVADPTKCVAVPLGWSSTIGPYCSDSRYLDGEFCDCGCGILDPDCASVDAECNGLPLGCIPEEAVNLDGELDMRILTQVPSNVDNTNCVENTCGDNWTAGAEECDDGNTSDGDTCDSTCIIEHPPEWTCGPQFYNDDQCDCGCGSSDPACPADALDPATDCAFDDCRGPEFVNPAQHGQCLPRDDTFRPSDAEAGVPDGGPSDGSDGCSASTVPSTSLPAFSLGIALSLLPLTRRRRTQ